MWDKPPFLLGGAQAQHGAVGSEVLIRDIPGLSGIRPGNPILAGATSFARGSDQKERVACESCRALYAGIVSARHQARMVVLDWVCPASVPLCPT